MLKLNKVKYSILIFTILVISFFSSYFIFSRLSNKDKGNTKTLNNISSVNSNNYISKDILKEETVNKDTKISFKIEYKKSGDVVDEKINEDLSSLVGKTKKKLKVSMELKGILLKKWIQII